MIRLVKYNTFVHLQEYRVPPCGWNVVVRRGNHSKAWLNYMCNALCDWTLWLDIGRRLCEWWSIDQKIDFRRRKKKNMKLFQHASRERLREYPPGSEYFELVVTLQIIQNFKKWPHEPSVEFCLPVVHYLTSTYSQVNSTNAVYISSLYD